MKKKAIIIIAFVIIAALFAAIITKRSNHNLQIEFLRTYGSINYIRGKDNTVSLAFLASNDFDTADMHSIGFSSPCLKGHVDSVNKSINYGGVTLYYLNLSLDIDSSCSELEVEDIVFNGERKELGKLTIYCVDDIAQCLSLKSNLAASIGVGLKNYSAKYSNETDNTIILTNATIPNYENASIYYYSNGSLQVSQPPIMISPHDTLQICVEFQDSNVISADVYYVSPIIEYECNGERYALSMPYYTSGLNITESDFKELYHKYYVP